MPNVDFRNGDRAGRPGPGSVTAPGVRDEGRDSVRPHVGDAVDMTGEREGVVSGVPWRPSLTRRGHAPLPR